ncbi:hypothetical protein [Streptomyces erythrochromogenes]|uniref:hypothetical protein n=1 Tax=Streptomyces erythrochromogenes TaxID=285574 RepID=UPI0002DA54A1
MVDAALKDVAAADGQPELPWMRRVLGYFFHRQFHHVDGYTNTLPWCYSAFPELYYRSVRTRPM